MSFLKSAINQVGRDLGKVISNQVFKDSHSSPYRRVGNNVTKNESFGSKKVEKTEFEKAINFNLGFKPKTLMTKVAAAYAVLKSTLSEYVSDGYLDTDESSRMFNIVSRFNAKIDEVCDVLEIDEKSNQNELEQLDMIVKKTVECIKEILLLSAEGCKKKSAENMLKSESIKYPSLIKYVGFHLIWMGKYARGEKKSLTNTILANIADILTLTFPVTRSYLLVYGLYTYWGKFSETKKRIGLYKLLSDTETKRASAYLGYLKKM